MNPYLCLQFQTPLHLATITKNVTIMKLLLEAGASPNTPDRNGNTCCHLAVKKNAIKCLQAIVEYSKEKVDINAKNFEGEQLEICCTSPNLKYLLQFDVNVVHIRNFHVKQRYTIF